MNKEELKAQIKEMIELYENADSAVVYNWKHQPFNNDHIAYGIRMALQVIDQLDDPKPTLSGKEWLREKLREKAEEYFSFNDEYEEGSFDSYQYVLRLIDQLEEPEEDSATEFSNNLAEAASFIRNGMRNLHSENRLARIGYEIVNVNENVVVEKPVVPQFIANHIEHARDYLKTPLYTNISGMFVNKDSFKDITSYFNNHTKAYITAWLFGYEVEEEPEQKYYVRFVDSDGGFLNIMNDGGIIINNRDESEIIQTKFTEQEIKATNPNYWPFAVPIEEVDDE